MRQLVGRAVLLECRLGLRAQNPIYRAWIKPGSFQPLLRSPDFLIPRDGLDRGGWLGRSGSVWRLYLCTLFEDRLV